MEIMLLFCIIKFLKSVHTSGRSLLKEEKEVEEEEEKEEKERKEGKPLIYSSLMYLQPVKK